MGALRDALGSLDLKQKENIALQAAIKGLDLDTVITAFDAAFEVFAELYHKNLETLNALKVAHDEPFYKTVIKDTKTTHKEHQEGKTGLRPHMTVMDEYVGNSRCEGCGIIIFDEEVYCPECKEGKL